MPGEAPEGSRRRRDRHRRGDRADRGDRTERETSRTTSPVADALTGDSERNLASQAASEPVAAEPSAPAFDTPVQGEARDNESRTRDVERAEPPHHETKVIAPQFGAVTPEPSARPAVEAASLADQARPVPVARSRPQIDVPPIASTLPPDSGLEIVETRFKPAPLPEADAVQSGPRRVRPPRVAVAEEPLQIVETRKDEQPPAG